MRTTGDEWIAWNKARPSWLPGTPDVAEKAARLKERYARCGRTTFRRLAHGLLRNVARLRTAAHGWRIDVKVREVPVLSFYFELHFEQTCGGKSSKTL